MITNFHAPYTIINIPGRISPEILLSIKQKFEQLIRETEASYVLNMENVDNLFSSTLSVMMHIYKVVGSMGGTLAMVNVAPSVQTALEFLKITTEIPVFPSLLDYELEHETINTAPAP